jgi:hypothetical protein
MDTPPFTMIILAGPTGAENVENLDAYDCRNVAVAIQFWRDSNSAAG